MKTEMTFHVNLFRIADAVRAHSGHLKAAICMALQSGLISAVTAINL